MEDRLIVRLIEDRPSRHAMIARIQLLPQLLLVTRTLWPAAFNAVDVLESIARRHLFFFSPPSIQELATANLNGPRHPHDTDVVVRLWRRWLPAT